MNTRSVIAMVGSLVIVAASVALFAHSMRAPAYDIALAPSVIDGKYVQNMAPVEVTADAIPAHDATALRGPMEVSTTECPRPRALAGLRQVMPYYSFAHALTSVKE